MYTHTVLQCKKRLAARLMEIQIYFDPVNEPIPQITQITTNTHVRYMLAAGKWYGAISKDRAMLCTQMLKDYNVEVYELKDPPKSEPVNKEEPISTTPYTDLQDELDESMGVIGVVMGLVTIVLLLIVLYVTGRFNF